MCANLMALMFYNVKFISYTLDHIYMYRSVGLYSGSIYFAPPPEKVIPAHELYVMKHISEKLLDM